jgi:imidazolonepropionase-like amidohydrolase
MRQILLLVPICVALSSCTRWFPPPPNPQEVQCDFVILNVGLFDGHADRGIVDIAIGDGGRILDISQELIGYKGAETIDGAGKFIVPGLINAHVHLWNKDDLRAALDIGVFAVVDLHSSEGPDALFRSLRDSPEYASYYSAGYAATVPRGHPTQLFPIETINEKVSPAQFVDNRVSKGADLIKIVSGNVKPGSVWFGNPTLSFDQIGAITEAAKGKGKKVVVHVSQVEEAMEIAKLGVDGFAHLWSYNQSATDEQLRVLAEKKVFVVPTAIIQKKAWESVEKHPGGKNEFKGSLSTMPVTYREIRRVHEAGIAILAGTDPPNYGINYTTDLFEELSIYSKAGLSNLEVLKTATGNPSVALGLGGLGVIEKGSKANFIILRSNPLADLSALRELDGIWKNGLKVR